ncbi:MAG: hypothetical protein COV10_00930 [Candidatus Vogelbacteria bacterium CG10_big_fil_rev_8_21_14_0_10_51_16]|uniref:Transcription regulator TrmB N-terminal domain-containing protein n=1 Tax=Candidatus Vogelbacteria bacterium CG10_big_fil_rev_8_21_14_0_10_51_16 TaxID=1975045 RepID=A0A2H0RH14_9BACT|nr:MAG: hypothetical protein COV10_00930 [Candidatus Vogelbacteria bacterium CG10_big_fil_rev_8_21_14_0_10_51_16]
MNIIKLKISIDKIDITVHIMITPAQFSEIGLNESEGRVYLYLLEHGLSTPPQVAKGTGIMRTNTYHLLAELVVKGLVEERKEGKRKTYLAADPAALLRLLDEQRERVERFLPDLRALHATQKNKPKVRFFDGLAEVKRIYEEASRAEEVHGIGSTKSLAALDPAFWAAFLRDCKKNGVVFHDILTHPSGAEEGNEMHLVLGGLYDHGLLPKTCGDQPTDILIWGDQVALITLEEPIFGTVLTSPLLAQSFRIIWRTMRQGLSENQ